jgi:hypothetical protein
MFIASIKCHHENVNLSVEWLSERAVIINQKEKQTLRNVFSLYVGNVPSVGNAVPMTDV